MAVPSPPTKSDKKHDIRKKARKSRTYFVSQLEGDARRALEEQLAENVAPFLTDAKTIGAYIPIGSEISPGAIVKKAVRQGKTIAYPTFSEGDQKFTFCAGEPIMPGPYQIMQPAPDSPVVTPDVVLLPLIACLDGGMRIGQGKGHYDRALEGLKSDGVTLIGLGWQSQRLDLGCKADSWDVPIDLFISPRGVEKF
ncbi:5-formyltetrahydrofolate cyclo-ligase [Sphingomicrobium marinum]|uniref:5-formyltetrahydrofolate cyclo-ligase n=1 Tax=Sphingomicrobium marinum TaxID=1227950 RepID=UPI0022408B5C|nr:5-formyltetrahydrofolate cyclo-ligase [Sphingomicrobium marinum]